MTLNRKAKTAVTNLNPQQKLNRQRILIIACVILALAFAAGNIIASLGTWKDVYGAAPVTAPSEPNRP
jgi:hypothetical protein